MEQHHLHTKQRQFWALWKCLFWVFWKRTGPWAATGTSPCQRGQRRGRSVHVSVPLELPRPSVIDDHVNTALGGTQRNRSSARSGVPATQPLCRGQDPRETPRTQPPHRHAAPAPICSFCAPPLRICSRGGNKHRLGNNSEWFLKLISTHF